MHHAIIYAVVAAVGGVSPNMVSGVLMLGGGVDVHTTIFTSHLNHHTQVTAQHNRQSPELCRDKIMAAEKIQWDRAQEVVKRMYENRGLPTIETSVVKGVTWVEASQDPSSSGDGTSAVQRGLARATAMLSPTTACVGKSEAVKAVT